MALSLVKFGVDNFHRVGVPPHKLVLTFPFYGYVFNVRAATVSWAVPVADSDGRPLRTVRGQRDDVSPWAQPGLQDGGMGHAPSPSI